MKSPDIGSFEKYDVNGNPLSRKDIAKAMKINIIAGFFGLWWWAVAAGVPTTMLVECLSGSGVVIGLIVTLQQIAMLVQIPSALVFEKMPRRKKLWAILAICMRLLWLVPAVAPLIFHNTPSVAVTFVLGAVCISFMIAHFCSPIWQSWMADLIPASLSGKFWGFRQSIVMMSFLASTVAMGLILDHFPDPKTAGGNYNGFAIVFILATVAGVGDILIHMFVPEPAHTIKVKSVNLIEKIIEPLKNADYRNMTLTFAIWYFAIGLIGSFAIVYLKRVFMVNYTHLAMLVVSSSIGPVLFGILGGFLIDKMGARILSAILFAAGAVTFSVWFFIDDSFITLKLPLHVILKIPQPVFIIFIVNFIGGIINGWLGLAQFHMVNVMSPREGRGMAIATHWSLVGLLSAAGPLTGGIIMDYFSQNPLPYKLVTGVPFAYIHILIVISICIHLLICLPLILRIKAGAGEMEMADVFKGIKRGNPLRAASSLFNIYLEAFDLEKPTKTKKTNKDIGKP